jgi:hypothetical protein
LVDHSLSLYGSCKACKKKWASDIEIS